MSPAVPEFYVAALVIMYALRPSALYDDLKRGSTKEGQRPSDARCHFQLEEELCYLKDGGQV